MPPCKSACLETTAPHRTSTKATIRRRPPTRSRGTKGRSPSLSRNGYRLRPNASVWLRRAAAGGAALEGARRRQGRLASFSRGEARAGCGYSRRRGAAACGRGRWRCAAASCCGRWRCARECSRLLLSRVGDCNLDPCLAAHISISPGGSRRGSLFPTCSQFGGLTRMSLCRSGATINTCRGRRRRPDGPRLTT